ncbi:MAG: dihydroorotate dehydrogenase-like protein [Pseudomonadota bacterium]|nr:dihydroorotate dehydrogenase-like protein [Pseudomonadota bacterium]
MGLKLVNPLVPSASPLSRSLNTARRLEDAGAAAIVMYSLFEEELRHEEERTSRFLIHQEIGHAEASSFLPFHTQYRHGLDQYQEHLAALKRSLDIPVIASLNGVSLDGWVKHGVELQQAGADALELNVYYVAADIKQSGEELEARYLELVRELRSQVTIPITVKLSSQFTSVLHFVKQLEEAGADGVALFNRFYQPDIDLEILQVTPQQQLSSSADALLAMRWIAILYGRVRLSLAATGGIHSASDALKMLLAGADVTHLCSTLISHGPQRLAQIKSEMETWMEEQGFDSVTELKGRVSQQHAADPAAFERANYLWVLYNYSPGPGVRR